MIVVTWFRFRFGETCRYLHEYSAPSASARFPPRSSFTDPAPTPSSQYQPPRDARSLISSLDEQQKAELRALLALEDGGAGREERPVERKKEVQVPEYLVRGLSEEERVQYQGILNRGSPRIGTRESRSQSHEDLFQATRSPSVLFGDQAADYELVQTISSIKILSLSDDELEAELKLPAASLAEWAGGSSDAGSEKDAPSCASPELGLTSATEFTVQGSCGLVEDGFLRYQPFATSSNGNLLDRTHEPATAHSSIFSSLQLSTSPNNPSKPPSSSSHNKISSPEIMKLFGAQVPSGAVSFGGSNATSWSNGSGCSISPSGSMVGLLDTATWIGGM